MFILVFFVLLRDSRFFFFFFQAEDGIRDADVTGVQTCALPIWDNIYSASKFPARLVIFSFSRSVPSKPILLPTLTFKRSLNNRLETPTFKSVRVSFVPLE